MSEPITKTFTKTDLEQAANAFIQQHGAGEELEWRWERTGMLLDFIASLFPVSEPVPAVQDEPWYVQQRQRWDALCRLGWSVTDPEPREGQVGIRMTKGQTIVQLYTSQHANERVIHTRLLRAAEAIAQSN